MENLKNIDYKSIFQNRLKFEYFTTLEFDGVTVYPGMIIVNLYKIFYKFKFDN